MAKVKSKKTPEKAYKGEITLAFDYQGSHRYPIKSEYITYVMIEKMYENVNILPVIYLNVSLDAELYDKVIQGVNDSKFYLKIRKKNAKSKTASFAPVLEDTFTYVTSNTNVNFGDDLNTASSEDSSYMKLMIGLVSANMTNELRKNFNNVYNNISQEDMLKNVAMNGLGKIVMEPLDYNLTYKSFLIPPKSSRYKMIQYIFDKAPFYNSNFTFFMDFDCTYLVSKNGKSVDKGDGKPGSVIVNIKKYSEKDGYKDGATEKNGAYILNVNASDSNLIVNNATPMATNKIVSYWDTIEENKEYEMANNNVYNTEKTTYIRSNKAAAIKNELDTTAVMLELSKQNIDGDIFTPNKVFNVTHYGSNAKYNGTYFLSFKREFYYINEKKEFIVTTNVGLKKTTNEEIISSSSDRPNRSYNSFTSSSGDNGSNSRLAGTDARMV